MTTILIKDSEILNDDELYSHDLTQLIDEEQDIVVFQRDDTKETEGLKEWTQEQMKREEEHEKRHINKKTKQKILAAAVCIGLFVTLLVLTIESI